MNIFLSEFIGTTILILLGNGVVANVVLNKTYGNNGGIITITTGWAFAVFCAVVIAQPSGAHLNPAITLALAYHDAFAWSEVPSYILAQMGGAMLGSTIVWIMYKDHYDISSDNPSGQLATFATSPAIPNIFRNIFSEIIGAFVLVFVVLWAGTEENAGLKSLGPLTVAITVFAIGLSLGGTTGYAINPARDLGPRIMHTLLPMKGKSYSNWGYAWIPVVGPMIGGILAVIVFNGLIS